MILVFHATDTQQQNVTDHNQSEAKEVMLPQGEGPLDKYLNILVKTDKDQPVSLEVRSCDTVRDVKRMIQEKEGIHQGQQKLTFGGTLLEDDHTLSHYNITEQSTLQLELLDEVKRICVRYYKPEVYQWNEIALDTSGSDTIKDVKKKIAEKEGIAVLKQRLYVEGKELEDYRVWSSYDIENGSTLRLGISEGEIEIFIKTLHEEIIVLKVAPCEPIGNIKAMIEVKKGIPIENQKLVFRGKWLEKHYDNHLLSDFHVVSGNTFNLLVLIDANRIFIKLPTSKVITIDMEPSDLIKDVKRKIREFEGVPLEHQKLFLRDDPLEDDRTLIYYNIRKGSILNLEVPPELKLSNISVKTPTGGTIKIDCLKCNNIWRIITQIQEKERIAEHHHKLFLAGEALEDNRTLSEYNIGNDSTSFPELELKTAIPLSIRICAEQKTVLFQVRETTTIATIKDLIQNQEGIPSEEQRLIFRSDELEDRRTLSECKINEEPAPELLLGRVFQVNVKTTSGDQFTLKVLDCDAIKEVKTRIHEKKRMQTNQQRLFFAGEELHDDFTLYDYNINKEVTKLPELCLQREVKLCVKVLKRDNIHLKAAESTTIADVKGMIHIEEGIPPEKQILVLEDSVTRLADAEKLIDCGIYEKHFPTIHLRMLMKIRVRNEVESTTPMPPMYTVLHDETIKDFITEKNIAREFTTEQHKLFHDGEEMKDYLTFSEVHEPLSQYVLKRVIPVPVKIKDKTITLNLDPSATIADIKMKIQQKEGIPIEDQRLYCEGKLLFKCLRLPKCLLQQYVELQLRRVTELSVRILNDKTISLEVEYTCTIETLKNEIRDKEGIPVNLQRLLFRNKQLKNSWTLSKYKIKSKSTLNLLCRQEDEMQIFVHSFRGEIFALEVKPSDTITDVKAKIREKEEIQVKDQRLMFGGKELENGCTLAECGIQEEFTVHMAPRCAPKLYEFLFYW